MSWFKRLFGSEKPSGKPAASAAAAVAPAPAEAPLPSRPAALPPPAAPPGPAERPTSPGKPSSEHPDYVSEVRDLGDAYELAGSWMDQIFHGASVRVPKALDVPAFLAQEKLPPLLPENPKYLQGLTFRGEEADHALRQEWAEVLLHHPDPAVVLATLGCPIPTDTLSAQHTLAYLLTFGNPEIEAAAARAVWANTDLAAESFAYRTMLTVLAGRGMVPSGVDHCRARAAVRRLHAACPPEICPEQREEFVTWCKEYFGEDVFG